MMLNVSKFQLLKLDPLLNISEDTSQFTQEYGETIYSTDHVKDLRVLVDNKVDFKAQRQGVQLMAWGCCRCFQTLH